MNLFRSEEHTRRWPLFNPRAEEGFISLAELAAFFGTETRHHMLDAEKHRIALALAPADAVVGEQMASAREEQAETQAYLGAAAKKGGGFGLTLGERLKQARRP